MEGRGVYPIDWKAVATRIKDLANWQCEHCGHPHDPDTEHILTVHHLDGDRSNNSDTNLVALCQRSHLHVQARYSPGQLVLPGLAAPAWLEERL